jgi:hypothetical protein
MKRRNLVAKSAKWLLAGAVLTGSASSAQAVILDVSGMPTFGDPNLTAWFRADSGVTLNGATVSRWGDLSDIAANTDRDVMHATAGNQPTFIAASPTLNNMPTVRFDGTNDFLRRHVGGTTAGSTTGVPQPAVGNGDRTVFAVVTNILPRPGTNGVEHVLHWGQPAVAPSLIANPAPPPPDGVPNDEAYGMLASAGGMRTYSNHYWSGFDVGTNASSARPTVVTFSYDNDFLAGIGRAGADRFWVNGNAAGMVDIQGTNTAIGTPATATNRAATNPPGLGNHQLKTGSNGAGQFALGSRISGWSEGFMGEIAEVIIYDQALSTADRTAVEGYLSNRYGISFAAPTGTHPLPFAFNAANAATAVNSLVFNGSAVPAVDSVDGAPVARLTPNAANHSGTLYLNKPVALAADKSFSTQFEVRLNNGGPGPNPDCCGDNLGADGMVFMLHQDPRGTVAAGAGGGGFGVVGAAPNATVNNPTVGPALMIELDTWHSGSWDVAQNTNVNGNHIAINTSGSRFSIAQSGPGAIPQWTAASNAPTRNVWVDYDGQTNMLNLYVSADATKPASPTLSRRMNLDTLFNGNEVYAGFGAGTGGAFATTELRSWSFDSQPSSSAPAQDAPVEFDFPDFTGLDGNFQFNGTAGAAGLFDGKLRLTNNVGSQAGSAFLNVPASLRSDFRFSTKFSFQGTLASGGGPAGPGVNGPGADGLAFVLTTGPNGPAVVGGVGGAIGIDGIPGNWVAVEIDTWGGGSFDAGVVAGQTHIGVDASNPNLLPSASLGRADIPRFYDDGERFVWVDYYGSSKQMQVFYSNVDIKPELPTLTVPIDLAAMLGYAYEDVYMGFAGGTGGSLARHEITSWSLAAVPEPSTYVLLSMGVFGLVAARRRIKK